MFECDSFDLENGNFCGLDFIVVLYIIEFELEVDVIVVEVIFVGLEGIVVIFERLLGVSVCSLFLYSKLSCC